CLQYNSGPYTF
nr:immunoglobulin light chain junction region [Macaca mulatta]